MRRRSRLAERLFTTTQKLSPVSKEGQRVEVAVFENLGDGSFAARVTYTVGGADLEYAMAIAAGDFNGDGVTDIAVTTMGEASPYPVAVNVLLSNCE